MTLGLKVLGHTLLAMNSLLLHTRLTIRVTQLCVVVVVVEIVVLSFLFSNQVYCRYEFIHSIIHSVSQSLKPNQTSNWPPLCMQFIASSFPFSNSLLLTLSRDLFPEPPLLSLWAFPSHQNFLHYFINFITFCLSNDNSLQLNINLLVYYLCVSVFLQW